MSSSASTQPKSAGFNTTAIAVDLVLCTLCFALVFFFVRSHVMASDIKLVTVFSAYTTLCVTGVFWMALQMLRVVAKGEKILKAERAGH